MQIVDLFSGIGGFSLSGDWMGWKTIQFCEIDKFCQRVLSYHFPGVPIHDDINTLTVKQIKENDLYKESEPTIFTMGVPCQPWSAAGKRKGTEDNRNLWPQSLELFRQFKPEWGIFENVYGFTNWSGGLVFRQVLSDLENEGYEVQPFIIPACAVNAPHRRDRVWIVAHAKCTESRSNRRTNIKTEENIWRGKTGNVSSKLCSNGPTADTDKDGFIGSNCEYEVNSGKRRVNALNDFKQNDVADDPETGLQGGGKFGNNGEKTGKGKFHRNLAGYFCTTWTNFPTQPPLRSRNDGIPGRLDGITISKLRNESIKAYGNAIVPQVAYEIFKAIKKYETL